MNLWPPLHSLARIILPTESKTLTVLTWRSDVTLWGSWITPDTGRAAAMFSPEIQLWPWLVARTRASKHHVRYSTQRTQWNPLNGTLVFILEDKDRGPVNRSAWHAYPHVKLWNIMLGFQFQKTPVCAGYQYNVFVIHGGEIILQEIKAVNMH